MLINITKNGRILWGLRAPTKGRSPGTWGLGGGNPDEGETYLEACVREDMEEMPPRGKAPQKTDAIPIHFHRGKNKNIYIAMVVCSAGYDVDVKSDNPKKPEHSGHAWIHIPHRPLKVDRVVRDSLNCKDNNGRTLWERLPEMADGLANEL